MLEDALSVQKDTNNVCNKESEFISKKQENCNGKSVLLQNTFVLLLVFFKRNVLQVTPTTCTGMLFTRNEFNMWKP